MNLTKPGRPTELIGPTRRTRRLPGLLVAAAILALPTTLGYVAALVGLTQGFLAERTGPLTAVGVALYTVVAVLVANRLRDCKSLATRLVRAGFTAAPAVMLWISLTVSLATDPDTTHPPNIVVGTVLAFALGAGQFVVAAFAPQLGRLLPG